MKDDPASASTAKGSLLCMNWQALITRPHRSVHRRAVISTPTRRSTQRNSVPAETLPVSVFPTPQVISLKRDAFFSCGKRHVRLAAELGTRRGRASKPYAATREWRWKVFVGMAVAAPAAMAAATTAAAGQAPNMEAEPREGKEEREVGDEERQLAPTIPYTTPAPLGRKARVLKYRDPIQVEESPSSVEAEVTRLLGESYERVKLLLKKHVNQLEAVANALLEKETLTTDDILKIVDQCVPYHAGEVQNHSKAVAFYDT